MTQPTLRPLRVAYVGNFGAPHSTENHVAEALEANGHTVVRWQENHRYGDGTVFGALADHLAWQAPAAIDLVLWTRTGWDWGAIVPGKAEQAHSEQHDMLQIARETGVATCGFHLDRWWGLDRQGQVRDEPFFRCDLVVTADGGHDGEWADAGVNHVWMPPGVSAGEAMRRPSRRTPNVAPVLFVGSASSYHPEWGYRLDLIQRVRAYFGARFQVVERGYRGQRLVDLYGASKVVLGDSCLAPAADGSPMTRYWSDRVPETIGRGGFLIHPDVVGLAEHFLIGGHLVTYRLGDWDDLMGQIDYYLSTQGSLSRRSIAAEGQAHVVAHHTYDVRMRQLQALLADRGLVAG